MPPSRRITASIKAVWLSADTGTPSDFSTSIASQTISGTLRHDLRGTEFVEVSLDGGSTWQRATTSRKSWSLAGATLLSGTNTLQVRVSDALGRSGPVFASAGDAQPDRLCQR